MTTRNEVHRLGSGDWPSLVDEVRETLTDLSLRRGHWPAAVELRLTAGFDGGDAHHLPELSAWFKARGLRFRIAVGYPVQATLRLCWGAFESVG